MDKKSTEGKKIDQFDPFEINFLPEFEKDRGPREPFVNQYGVMIGDHMYESPNSPLQQWSTETDPSIMAGDQWVHPYKDIGFKTEENMEYFEKGIWFKGARFMHPTIDAAYEVNLENWDGEPAEENKKAMQNRENNDPTK